MRPTVSVVVPHYNHGKYVADCVNSLLGQTYPLHELIIVDDGSTDGSMPILESFTRDPRVRLVRHERNLGCTRALNDGLALCTGDYVLLYPADDFLKPDFLEKSIAALVAHPEAGLSCTLVSIADEQGRDLGPYVTPIVRDRTAYLTPAEYVEEFRRHGSWVLSYSTLLRRSAVVEAGGCPPELPLEFDNYLTTALATRYGVCFIPERLAMWRRSTTSMAYSYARDAGMVIKLFETLDARFASLRPPTVTPEVRALILGRGLNNYLDILTWRRPFPTDEARRIAAHLPGGGFGLLLYRLALALGGGWAATKLYMFSLLPAREQARILAGKLRRRSP
jgi:glycosyltransferase involved in cell wall biosynthesis